MEMEKQRNEVFTCPVARFFMDLGKKHEGRSEFVGHLRNSRVEFLKAIRSLIDEGISRMEKDSEGKGGKKAEKIEVE
jgi:hypothetical protein